MSFDELKQDVKAKNYRSSYLFYGPEDYLKKQYAGYVVRDLIDDSFKMMNLNIFESKFNMPEIRQAVQTAPFMSKNRVVFLKNTDFFKSAKISEVILDELSELLTSIPEHTCLVFLEENADVRLKSVNVFKKHGLVVNFEYQKPEDIAKWVTIKLREERKEIDAMTAALLVDYCESGLGVISGEMEKLIIYTGDRRRITGDDIEAVCTKSLKNRIFDLTAAFSTNGAGAALRILDELIASKEPVQMILFMIEKYFRTLLQVKLYATDGMTQQEISSKMKQTPFLTQKFARQAGAFDIKTVEQAIYKCHEYDLKIKSGRIADRTAAELLIAEFSK